MATTLQLTNKVLRGLRQFALLVNESDTSYTDDYLLLILQFINEAKEEVEENGWPWFALRNAVQITLAQGTATYTLTSAADANVDTNDRTRMLYQNNAGRTTGFYQSVDSLPMIFVTSETSEYRLREITWEEMQTKHLTDDDEQGKPMYFAMYTASGAKKIQIYPVPDAAYTVTARLFIPQDELTSTTITTTLSIPSRPVYLRALFKANQERGSELGQQDSTLDRAQMDALGVAVAAEMTPDDETVHLER